MYVGKSFARIGLELQLAIDESENDVLALNSVRDVTSPSIEGADVADILGSSLRGFRCLRKAAIADRLTFSFTQNTLHVHWNRSYICHCRQSIKCDALN